jgi:hypothetical protein
MDEVSLGQYSLPVILTVLMGLIYKLCEREDGSSCVPARYKPAVAVGLGLILGIVALFYKGLQPTFPIIVDHILYGFMAGSAAVGLWELSTKTRGK